MLLIVGVILVITPIPVSYSYAITNCNCSYINVSHALWINYWGFPPLCFHLASKPPFVLERWCENLMVSEAAHDRWIWRIYSTVNCLWDYRYGVEGDLLPRDECLRETHAKEYCGSQNETGTQNGCGQLEVWYLSLFLSIVMLDYGKNIASQFSLFLI